MKSHSTCIRQLVLLMLLTITSRHAGSQVLVNSSNGYNVNVFAFPNQVIPSSMNCPNGYNYNLRIAYIVSFSGNNIPSNLYTLQGNVKCGSQTLFFSLPTAGGIGFLTTTSNPWRGVSDCHTVTPTSLNCNTAVLTINGPGIPNQNINFNLTIIPLAVQLLQFTATPDAGRVQLNWSTASETGNAFFEIERSANGTDWITLSQLPGAGTSTDRRDYAYTDPAPLSGTSYYRVKETGFDQRTAYSAIRTVTIAPGKVSIFPVPNTGHTINFRGMIAGHTYRCTITDISGRTMYAGSLSSSRLETDLVPGMYVINLADTQQGEQQRMTYIQQ